MNALEQWVADLAAELGVDPDAVDRDVVLDLARDAAHAVARPAAPLTTYLVGLAAGRRGGSVEALADAAATAQRLAARRTGGYPGRRLVIYRVGVDEARRIADARPADHDRWAPGYPFAGDREATTAYLAATGRDGDQGAFSYYRITRLADGRAIGGIGFLGRPDEHGAVEVGFGLIPSVRGEGYAREALTVLLDVAREHDVAVVRAATTPANVASRRTLLGAGLFEDGTDADGLVRYRVRLGRQARAEPVGSGVDVEPAVADQAGQQ